MKNGDRITALAQCLPDERRLSGGWLITTARDQDMGQMTVIQDTPGAEPDSWFASLQARSGIQTITHYSNLSNL